MSTSAPAQPAITRRSLSIPAASQTALHPIVIAVLASTAIVAGALLLWAARAAILLIFASVLVAIMLRGAASFIQSRTGVSSRLSLALVIFAIALILGSGIWLRGSEIASQLDQLQQKLPAALEAVMKAVPRSVAGRWVLRHADAQQIPRFMDILPGVTGFLSGAFGLIASLVLVLYVGITLAAEPQTYRSGIEQLCPTFLKQRIANLLDALGSNLQRWMLIRLASMVMVALLVSIGLYALHIPLAGTLGALAGLMTFIPNFGPILSSIPPVLLAFTVSPKQAFFVILLFMAVHFVEGFLLSPIAERTIVHLPPALTLSVQLLLATFCGAIGVALAAPVTVVIVVLIRELRST